MKSGRFTKPKRVGLQQPTKRATTVWVFTAAALFHDRLLCTCELYFLGQDILFLDFQTRFRFSAFKFCH
jgi:hypothetical protein